MAWPSRASACCCGGWARWLAVFAGFLGVLVILRPGSDFSILSLLAVAGLIGFAGRDLATRAAPRGLSNRQLGALGFTVLALADASFLHVTANMRQVALDTMMRHRIIVPRADPDIVIVDINEASLAALGKEYGRWPWPRQVLGEFLEQIEKQQPKAVVFDILFSDADVYNPDSDAYFDAAIAAKLTPMLPAMSLSDAARAAADDLGVPKARVYDIGIALKDDGQITECDGFSAAEVAFLKDTAEKVRQGEGAG